MVLLFAGLLALIALGLCAVQFLIRVRKLEVETAHRIPVGPVGRYQPMLRLLDDDDLALLSADKSLLKKVRRQRSEIFRGYLNCIAKDYGRLLAGVRAAMVRSSVDRPDLARFIAKSRLSFAFTLCRIEYRLWLYNAGIGRVDVSGLVDAMDSLRTQMSVLSPVAPLMAR